MENTLESNKLIAEFMGVLVTGQNLRNELVGQIAGKLTGPLNYHKDWNLLMPVVEKIEDTTVTMNVDTNEGLNDFEPDFREENWQFLVTIENTQCMIGQDVLPQYYGTDRDFLKTYDCRNEGKTTKLQATYSTVVQFIQWYNNQKEAQQ